MIILSREGARGSPRTASIWRRLPLRRQQRAAFGVKVQAPALRDSLEFEGAIQVWEELTRFRRLVAHGSRQARRINAQDHDIGPAGEVALCDAGQLSNR
jgi:hypothetical protein